MTRWIVLLLLACCGYALASETLTHEQVLAEIKAAGGLCVHLGSSDGAIETAAAESGRMLVHGLAVDDATVATARRAIEKSGRYGLASVVLFTGQGRLPYRDNLAERLVVTDWDGWQRRGLTAAETLRVVAPGGVAYFGLAGGAFRRVSKPWPAEMDRWPRHANAAAGKYISADAALKPPFELRWVDGPNYGALPTRSPSRLLISAGGRYYALTGLDVANFGSAPSPPTPAQDHNMVLLARSAFNGLPLWRSTAAGWGREACATAEHLFMPRPKEGKIVAYRGQTGEEAFVIETAGRLVEELAADDQCLYATTWNEKRQPAVECFDADTGKARWKSEGVGGAMTLGDDAIYLPGKRLLAIEKRSGATRWEASDLPVSVEVAFATPSAVIVSKHDKREEGQVIALAVKDGRRLWSAPLPPAAGPRPAFPWQGGVAILGARYDLQTGKATGPAPPSKQANCAANIVTPHGAITRGGTIVRGPDAADTIYFGGLRTQCGDAGMVANGMLYAGPTLCGCNSSGRVEGFPAFGAAARPPVGEDFQKPRPVLAGKGGTRPFVETEAQWPTYRHDPQRSGGSPIAVPPRLAVAFSQKLSDRPGGPVASSWASQPAHGLSAATLAGGLVYLADSESHRVIAVSAADGRTRWSFRADGRVDSPPTIHRGRCLFGSRDGWVYCLRADDGELVWRSRAAPAEQFLVAYGQIESAWPVPGCVAVIDDVVVAAAGRTWNVDGGIAFCGFRLDDGATAGAYPSGSRNDIPVSDGRDFYVQGYKLSADRPKPAAARDRPQQSPWEPDRRRNEPLLEGHRTGLLDATITLFPPWPIEWRATYKRLLGCSYAGTSAWLAVWNGPDVFYYDTDFTGRKTGPQRLFAKRLPPVKGQQPAEIWSVALPADCRVDAMLAASDALVAAGASGIGTEAQKGMVWVYRRRDGAIAQQVALPGVPVFQSLSAAPGQIFVSTTDGRLVCLAAAN